MRTYRSLESQVYETGKYSIVPIRFEDRYDIMRWRNEQIYHLRQNQPLTMQDQDDYFENIVGKLFEQDQPNQILFSYLEEGNCIGYGGLVHINWIDKNAEISFVMNTVLEINHFEFHWVQFLKLLESVAFHELNLHKIYTYAFDIRPRLYPALNQSGFSKEAILEEHCIFNDKFKNVVIHSKINGKLWFNMANSNHAKLLFDWANDKNVRMNSLDQNQIVWGDHLLWLENKIGQKKSKIFIFYINSEAVGQVRLDFSSENKNDNWLIDYSVDKTQRGKGIGTRMLKRVLNLNEYIPLRAIVKYENTSSLKIFRKLGFEERKLKNHVEFYFEGNE